MDSIFDISVSGYLPATTSWADYQIIYYIDGVLHYTAFSRWDDSYVWNDDSITITAKTCYYYDNGQWNATTVDDTVLFSSIAGQSLDAAKPKYYSSSDLTAGNVEYSYSSSAFAAMETATPLDEVIALLPVCIPVLVLYLAVRKGIAWCRSMLKTS